MLLWSMEEGVLRHSVLTDSTTEEGVGLAGGDGKSCVGFCYFHVLGILRLDHHQVDGCGPKGKGCIMDGA